MKRQPTGDPNDPQGMVALLNQFFQWMQVKNFSAETIETRQRHLVYFVEWAAARGITQPAEVTKPVVERYQRYLYHYRKRNGDPLSFQCQNARLVSLRCWFRWLARTSHVLYNPAADIELPNLERRLPKHVLTASQAEQVINQPDITTRLGIRDRAILETLYSTGLRRKEMVSLRPYDVDAERGTLIVRLGKGKKDRVVPIGERALAWIERYVVEVRPSLVTGDRADMLFLTCRGNPFTSNRMTDIVRKYVNAADIGKKGSCHLFRHTMATLMLDNGADIRFIQAILGHSRLETTEIYTHVSIRKLKEIHTATHPARMERSP